MSWSEFFTNVDKDEVADLVARNENTKLVAPLEFEEAKICALDMIQSGSLGDSNEYYFNLTLSGHVNPNHIPQAGGTYDTLTVSVTQGGEKSEVLVGASEN